MAAGVSLLCRRNAEQEHRALSLGLESQLYWDVLKIYTESLFWDVEIQFESSSIKTHSSFLLLYAPRFYAELLKLKETRNPVFFETAKDPIEKFIRSLYTAPISCSEEKETRLIKKLISSLKNREDESQELYLTPDSEINASDECDFDLERRNFSPSSLSTNPLYYALITLDDSYLQFDSTSEQLERELEEQDKLSESLRLISVHSPKENFKGNKRFSLGRSTQSPTSKNSKQLSNQKNCSKKGRKDTDQKLVQKPIADNEMNDSNENICQKDCCFGEVMKQSVSKKTNETYNYFNDSVSTNSETSGIGSSEQVGSSIDHLSNDDTSFAPNHGTNSTIDDRLTNTVIEAGIDHDTFQHTSSSNCANVSTKWEEPVSDYKTFVIDSAGKEINSRGEIDSEQLSNVQNVTSCNLSKNDKSSEHSNISGKTVPCISKEVETGKLKKSPGKDGNDFILPLDDWKECTTDHLPHLSNSALVESCSVLGFIKVKHQPEAPRPLPRESLKIKSATSDVSTASTNIFPSKSNNIDRQPFHLQESNFNTQSENLNHVDNVPPSASTEVKNELASFYEDSLENFRNSNSNSGSKLWKNETPLPSKNNFFIDASSLLDETELSLPLNISASSQAHAIIDSEEKVASPENRAQGVQQVSRNIPTGGISFTNQPILTEMPRLLRQKTFELEPSDEKLALLRQEYEKQQGDKIFHTSEIPCKEEGNSLDDNAINGEINYENDPKINNSDLPKYCYNHDLASLNSPDSLNNDDQPLNEENASHKDAIADSLNTHFVFGVCNENLGQNASANLVNEIGDTSTPHSSPKSVLGRENQGSDVGTSSLGTSCRRDLNKLNSLESIPIISGGIGVKDVSNPVSLGHSNNASPSMSRKIESSPILSSGAVSIESEPKVRMRKSNPLNGESWIIDLSDASKSSNTSRFDDSEDALTPPRSAKSSSSGSSFFIDLNEFSKDQDTNNSLSPKGRNQLKTFKNSRREFQNVMSIERTKVAANQQTRSCGFFVNLNDEPEQNLQTQSVAKASNDNLFTMFIDLNDPSKALTKSLDSSVKATMVKKRLKSHTDKISPKQNLKLEVRNHSTSDSDYEHPEIPKGKYISSNEFSLVSSQETTTSHSELIISKSQLDNQSNSLDSYSQSKCPSAVPRLRSAPVKHKRTHSISIDKIQQQINSIPDIDKFSSTARKFAQSGPASLGNRSKMTASWHGTNGTHADNDLKMSAKLATMDDPVDMNLDRPEESLSTSNHTDVSNNSTSLSEMGNSKHTFILDEEDTAPNPQLTYDLDTSATSHDNASDLSKDENSSSDLSKTETNVNSSLGLGVEKVALSKKKSATHCARIDDSFVKLSDMDKEPLKNLSRSKRAAANRMSRSIPEVSWIESKLQSKSATSRSLNRLFPQLSASINSRTSDYSDTDLSTISSMHSSLEPSVLESTEESEQETKNCSQLGEDLLRMFLDEISPDVIVEVGGRRIRAHKCILSSRCQYFAAILSGGWVQSAGDVISLQGFSYNVVHFALCHIYSGASNIPDSISIIELATLADMLCLEGLKEVISYTLKLKYCHFFHKPCSICTVGVLECLPLAAAYGLDDLYRKSLRWINKYFTKIWITKPFASLPRELIEKCYKQLAAHLATDSILDTLSNCKTLSDNIPNSRWAELLHDLVKRLNDACIKYMSQHFSIIIVSNKFSAFMKDLSEDRTIMQAHVLRAAELLSPDESCKSYGAINTLVSLNRSEDEIPDIRFLEFLMEVHVKVEDVLVKLARKAVKTLSWNLLDIELRNKIQKRACLIVIPGAEKVKIRSSANNKTESTPGAKTLELHKVKLVINCESEGTESGKLNGNNSSRPKTWPSQNFAQVKSRYLEQRPARNNSRSSGNSFPEKKLTPLHQKRLPAKFQSNKISSSDSSRTCSPAMPRPSNPRVTNNRSSQSTPLSQRKDLNPTDSLELSKPKPLSSRKSSLTSGKTSGQSVSANVTTTRTQNLRIAARHASTAGKKSSSSPKPHAVNSLEKKTSLQSPAPNRRNTSRLNNNTNNSNNVENKSPIKQRGKSLTTTKTDKGTVNSSGLSMRQSNFSNSDNKSKRAVNNTRSGQNGAHESRLDQQGPLNGSSRSSTFCKDESNGF